MPHDREEDSNLADCAYAGGIVFKGIQLKINRFGAAALSILAIGAVMLSASGSDHNATGGSATTGTSAKVTCGGASQL
jgi:phosphate transport system substrate-binding protein